MTADWLAAQIDDFSQGLKRLTVIVLDNAAVHKKMAREHGAKWEERGLYIGFLPPYSPHLNIVETLWKKLKYEWLRAEDYANKATLQEATKRLLGGVGKSLRIAFKPFNMPDITLA